MFGYYGKIVSQGDFLRRRADLGFVSQWDTWLQNSMSQSRASLGDIWKDAYHNAPIWRFCFGTKVCGPESLIGVMMPSQDRVGRLFPLAVFWRSRQSVAVEALENEPFMRSLENAALQTLEDGPARDRLNDVLQAMEPPQLPLGGADHESHWLSTFFAGEDRFDRFKVSGLPDPSQFVEFLQPPRARAVFPEGAVAVEPEPEEEQPSDSPEDQLTTPQDIASDVPMDPAPKEPLDKPDVEPRADHSAEPSQEQAAEKPEDLDLERPEAPVADTSELLQLALLQEQSFDQPEAQATDPAPVQEKPEDMPDTTGSDDPAGSASETPGEHLAFLSDELPFDGADKAPEGPENSVPPEEAPQTTLPPVALDNEKTAPPQARPPFSSDQPMMESIERPAGERLPDFDENMLPPTDTQKTDLPDGHLAFLKDDTPAEPHDSLDPDLQIEALPEFLDDDFLAPTDPPAGDKPINKPLGALEDDFPFLKAPPDVDPLAEFFPEDAEDKPGTPLKGPVSKPKNG